MDLQAVATIVTIAAGTAALVTAGAGIIVWYYGMKYFAPIGVEKRLREEIHSKLGNMELTDAQRHDAVMAQLRDLKEDIREALSKAHKAHERASEARHVALMAERSVQELRDGVKPLRDLEPRIARIEGYIERATSKGDDP